MRFISLLSLTVLAAALPVGPLYSQADGPALTLIGEDGRTRVLARAELLALPQLEVHAVDRDSTGLRFRGPTLRSLLTLVGAPTGQALRGPSLTLVVLAEATDGYRVVYSLAELDEQFGAREAILALTQDGVPLSARDGPYRVVISGERHHARWARQIVRLRLVRVAQ